MLKTALPLTLTLLLCPSFAQAGIHIDIHLPALPPLVEIRPGIQVVESFPEEVFFDGGWYWCRRPEGWYRARHPRDRFDWIDEHRIPPGLMREPIGRYRNWHHVEDGGYYRNDRPNTWHGRKYKHHPPQGYGPNNHGNGPDDHGNGPGGPGAGHKPPFPPPPHHP